MENRLGRIMKGVRRRPLAHLLLGVLLIAVLAPLLTGCGLQTEEANRKMAVALQHQQEAEAILARVNGFPAAWEAIFGVPHVTATQINGATQLLQARQQDLVALDTALKAWQRDLRSVLALNVDEKIKQYVRLKSKAVQCYSEYVSGFLNPIMKAYTGLLNDIGYARPATEVDTAASDISKLVSDSQAKLQECLNDGQQADAYFTKNKLGTVEK